MSNNSPALCQQAYNWIFDKLNKAKFCRELRSKASYSGILHLLTAGGFQLNEKTLLVRKDYLFRNLSKLKDGGFQLATAVAEDSDSISLVHEILSNLKEDTLLDDWRSIIESAETPGIVILALAMFQKDTWQFRLARRLMKTPSAWLGYTHYPDNSHLQYCQIILSLFDVFSSGKNELQSPDNAPSDDELKQLLEREYKRGKSEQEKKTADDKREREAKLKELTKQLQNAEKEIEQLKNEHTRLTQHADENIEALRSKMQEDFQNSIQQLASQWFISNHELQYDTAVAQNKTDAILAKLEQATREQLMQNQTSGSKHALREQRKKLHAAIESLKLAQQDAIVSVKGIPTLLREADQQLMKIESALTEEEDGVPSLACAQLAAFINGIKLDANAEAELDNALKFVQEAYKHELLHEGENVLLSGLVKRRKDILHSAKIMPALNKSLASLETSVTYRTREIWNLALDIPRLKKVTLVIDACNAILRSRVWSKMTADFTFDQAKQHFIEACKSRRHCFHSIEIVFDGTNFVTTSEKVADNVTVTFAAKKEEEHNADNVIIAMVPRLKESGNAELVWVVTDDYGLRDKLEDACDAFVTTFAVPPFFLTN